MQWAPHNPTSRSRPLPVRQRRVDLRQQVLIQPIGQRRQPEPRDHLIGRDVALAQRLQGREDEARIRLPAAREAGDSAKEAEIIAQFGESAFPNRVLMADLPEGAMLIPNPKNRVPGFSLGHLHFVPGFPEMAWPMIAWVLDQQYPHLPPDASNLEVAFILPDAKEADLLGTMQDLLRRFPAIRLSSLPSYGRGDLGPHIELGLKGPREDVKAANHWLKQRLRELGQSIQP